MKRTKIESPKNGLARRNFVAICVAALLILAGTQVAKAQAAPKQRLSEAQVLDLQKRFQDATVAVDVPVLSTLMADDAVFVHGSALVQTKAEFLESLSKGQLRITRYESKDSKVVFFDGGAIVSGPTEVVLAPGTVGREAFRVEMRVSSVWVATPTGWQVILVQGTPIQAPPRPPAQNGTPR